VIQIFNIVAPVFLLLGFGYAASALKLISDAAVDSLVKFVMTFAVTCLLFRATATLDIGNSMKLGVLVSFYFPAFICFFTGVAIARKVFGQRPGVSISSGFTTLFANSIFIGIPVAQRAYGAEADPTIFAIISIHAATMYGLGVVCMEMSARDGAGAFVALQKVARSLSRNPLVIAVSLGFAYNLIGLPIPNAADEALKLMAAAALPAGMFYVRRRCRANPVLDSRESQCRINNGSAKTRLASPPRDGLRFNAFRSDLHRGKDPDLDGSRTGRHEYLSVRSALRPRQRTRGQCPPAGNSAIHRDIASLVADSRARRFLTSRRLRVGRLFVS